MAAASKDGIESVHVKLAQTPPFYRAGEDLTGKIIVVCGATTPIKAVKVKNQIIRLNLNQLFTNILILLHSELPNAKNTRKYLLLKI